VRPLNQETNVRRLFPTFIFMLSLVASAQPLPSAGDQILGEWRGTSRCTNLTLLPACKDEDVRYTFTRNAGTNSYHQVADKLVAGSYGDDGRDGLRLLRDRRHLVS
jgi:hypothetical protein